MNELRDEEGMETEPESGLGAGWALVIAFVVAVVFITLIVAYQ